MKNLRSPVIGLVGAIVGGLMVGAVYQGISEDKPKKNEAPKFNIQEKAIQRSGPNVTTFAPVVKKVAPSVVSVYSTKMVKTDRRSEMFNDPMFRRFFGVPEEESDEDTNGKSGRSRARKHEETGLGSGVIVSENGYILTNNHVVEGADEIKVSLPGRKEEYIATVIGTDKDTDIAILKINEKGLPAITMTTSDTLEVGDVVLAVGNPFGVGQTVTMGIVSAVQRRGLGIVGYEDFIQTDASINPGNSGGALVDAEGRLVGIPTAIFSRSGGNQGIGFAVPVNMARFVMERLIDNGKVVRGYMGLLPQPITPDLAKLFNLKSLNGALVGQVVSDTPADKAGLKEGDVILEFNSRKVEDDRQLRLLSSQTAPGTKVPVKIIRDSKEKTLEVTLAELPGENKRQGGVGGKAAPAPREDALEGVEVGDLDNKVRRQFGIPANIQGAVVTNVDEESPAYKAGLRPGFVIMSIDRKAVKNADDAVKLSGEITNQKILLHVWVGAGGNGRSQFIVVDESKK
jgi:serine protease Do